MLSSTLLTLAIPTPIFQRSGDKRVDGIITARGDFRAQLTRIDLHRVWTQRGKQSLPVIIKFATTRENEQRPD